MKHLLTLFFLFGTFLLLSQRKIDGEFFGSRHYSTYRYTFKNDSLFEYHQTACRSWTNGYGKYKIIHDTLELNFTTADTLTGASRVHKISCNDPDSVTFTITVKETETNLPKTNAGTWYSRGRRGSGPSTFDENGKAVLRFKKSMDSFTLNVSAAMCIPVEVETNTMDCLDITVYIDEKFKSHVKKGEVWKYRIIRKKGKKLIISRNKFKFKLKKTSVKTT